MAHHAASRPRPAQAGVATRFCVIPPWAIATLIKGIHFPRPWKLGRVIRLPKPGKYILSPESHRSITLLLTTSKLFKTLRCWSTSHRKMKRAEQFGFRTVFDHSAARRSYLSPNKINFKSSSSKINFTHLQWSVWLVCYTCVKLMTLLLVHPHGWLDHPGSSPQEGAPQCLKILISNLLPTKMYFDWQ